MDTNNILNKSFMIGDWVLHDGKPKIVNVVWGNAVSLYEPEKTLGSIYADKYPLEEIEPVPLTVEILEKNGFFCYSDNRKCWRYNFVDANGEPEDGIYINADFETDEPFTAVSNRCYHAAPYCRYVHQLQHAILLCGLYKKIEL